MKKREILNERKALLRLAGKSEYFFFPSILLSAAAFLIIAVLATDRLMRVPEVQEAYGSAVQAVQNFSYNLPATFPAYLSAAVQTLGNAFSAALKSLPRVAVFWIILLFIVCPIYQGTVRWSAYLIEERSTLPIRAILFYFLSPRLYFSVVFLSLRLLVRKLCAAVLFLLPPAFCFCVSLLLGSDYYGQEALGAASLILSVVWFTLAAVLYFIFCQRYAAVRYLYALGETKKLFRASRQLTQERRVWFFTLRLRLLLNVFLALGIVTAPMAFSRIICGSCLAVRALIAEKKKAA